MSVTSAPPLVLRLVPWHPARMLLFLLLACGGDPTPTPTPAPDAAGAAAVEPTAGGADPTPAAASADPAAPPADPVAGDPATNAAAPAVPTPGAAPATPGAPPVPGTPPAAVANPGAAAVTPPATAATPGAPAAPPTTVGDPASAAPVIPTAWKLDPGASRLYVQVFKDPDTAGASLSHDHVIAAGGWTGKVRWDPANPAACDIQIDLPVTGLRVDEPALRKKVGYDVELSESQRADVKKNMLAADQLNGDKFPTITFRSSGCAASGDKVAVSGTLTVHGVGKKLTVPMKISSTEAKFSASGTFSAKATDFGFSPFSAMLGALKNKDSMSFTVDVTGTPGG